MGRAGADQYHKEVEGSGKGRGCTKPVIPVMSTVGIFDGDDRDQVQDKSQVRVNARGIRMARHGEKVTPFVVHRAVEVKWRSSASQREKWRTAEVEARHSSISLSSD